MKQLIEHIVKVAQANPDVHIILISHKEPELKHVYAPLAPPIDARDWSSAPADDATHVQEPAPQVHVNVGGLRGYERRTYHFVAGAVGPITADQVPTDVGGVNPGSTLHGLHEKGLVHRKKLPTPWGKRYAYSVDARALSSANLEAMAEKLSMEAMGVQDK